MKEVKKVEKEKPEVKTVAKKGEIKRRNQRKRKK